MKFKTYKKMSDLATALKLPPTRGVLAEIKAKLIKEIIKIIKRERLTHQEVSDLSGVPRSAVTGIVNGSLQRVSIERLIRIITALGKAIELKIKSAA
ncbi:MAG: XRE family transcriptional regulator [Bacteriovoracales bacterium]|nr:XRE family transcriptional regulator [Bacteriovoracales bacterium]